MLISFILHHFVESTRYVMIIRLYGELGNLDTCCCIVLYCIVLSMHIYYL